MKWCNAVLFTVGNWTIKNATAFSFVQIHRPEATPQIL